MHVGIYYFFSPIQSSLYRKPIREWVTLAIDFTLDLIYIQEDAYEYNQERCFDMINFTHSALFCDQPLKVKVALIQLNQDQL